jgi:WD40 repeat protein
MQSHGMTFLYEGDGYCNENKFSYALNCYEAQIITIRATLPVNVKLLAVCHGRLGKLYLKQEKYDRAIVEYDRQMSLANEIDDKVEAAEAYFGLGSGYVGKHEYVTAVRYLEISQSRFEVLGHMPRHCACLVLLRDCYDSLDKQDLVSMYTKRIAVLQNESKTKLQTIGRKIDEMVDMLRVNSAAEELNIQLERITCRMIELRQEQNKNYEVLADQEEELQAQLAVVRKIEYLLDGIQGEINVAMETDEKEMMSIYVHDQPQMVEIEELKTRLHQRKVTVLEDYKKEKGKEADIRTKIRNTEEIIHRTDNDIHVEQGPLMKQIKLSRPFRCVAFNPANAAGDEVTGTASGGVENFVAAESNMIHLLDFHNGELLHIFEGDDKANKFKENKGHLGVVTCLAYDGNRVYSGSADETIMVWDIPKRKRLMVLHGHEGTIVVLAISGMMLVSGGADSIVYVWNKHTGQNLRMVQGHSRSVLCLDVGLTYMVTGSVDEDVRLWTIAEKGSKSVSVKCTNRLVGHEAAVTAVKYGKLELVTADQNGQIIVWWLKTGEIIRRCKNIHNGRVQCLQFDATRIVSGGADNCICITDIGTGSIIQSLRAHTGQILNLAFDTERIVSVSRDNTLRYWKWGEKKGQPADKYHVMAQGETLTDIAKEYTLPMNNLMTWNGIKDVRDCFVGMRLIVRKGDPTKLTAAEEAVIEKERKRLLALARTNATIKGNILLKGNFPKYNRISRLATDQNYSSLGNRLFAQDKRKTELFPEKDDMDRDTNSLGYRLNRTRLGAKEFSPHAGRYFPSKANEDEWGEIADGLGSAMLEMFLELELYDIVATERRLLRDPLSVVGRMYSSDAAKAERISKSAVKRNRKKKKNKEKENNTEEVTSTLPPIDGASNEDVNTAGPLLSDLDRDDSRKLYEAYVNLPPINNTST